MKEKRNISEKNETQYDFNLFTLDLLNKYEDEIKELEKDTEPIQVSHRHKIRMNRLFREKVGGDFLPFPEVDTLFERIRSRFVILTERFKRY